MKKMNRFKLGLLLLILIFSCKKDDYQYCWECRQFVFQDYVGWQRASFTVCDRDSGWIYRFEQLNTESDGKGNGVDMECKKKI